MKSPKITEDAIGMLAVDALEKLSDTLLPKLMTGEVHVRMVNDEK